MNNREFFLEKARKGNYTLFYHEAGAKKYIHSRYDPEKEAEVILGNIDPQKYDFVVINGNGLGYVLKKLKTIKEIKKIIVIEKEEKISEKFVEINKNFDFTDIDFLINKEKEHVVNHVINEFNLINYKGFYLLDISSVVNIDLDYYIKLKVLLNEELQKKVNTQLTESRLGVSLLNNFFNNLQYINDIDLIRINKEHSKDKSVIIVSAGTSLTKDIERLGRIQNNHYIFSVDTALKYLLKNGIVPDAVFSMDPQYHTYYHFHPGAEGENTTYIIDIFAGFPALKVIEKYSFIISDNIVSNHLFNKKDIIQSHGGSITNFIFQYIQDYFNEIVFLGLDLCYDNLNMYVPYTYLNQYFLKRNGKLFSLQTQYFQFYLSRAKRKIKYDNKEYPTTMSMINYYQWIKEAVKNKNVFFSKNSKIEFENIKKIDIDDLRRNNKKENLFTFKKVNRYELIRKFKKLIDNSKLLKSLTNIIVFSKYLDQWSKCSDKEKNNIWLKEHKYLIKRIEKIE